MKRTNSARSWSAALCAAFECTRNIFTVCVVLLTLTGCSTFQKDWKAAAKSAAPHGIEGRWSGEWRSEKNNHHGTQRGHRLTGPGRHYFNVTTPLA